MQGPKALGRMFSMGQVFESHIQKMTPELFSFGFSLLPDDLQAQQIVIDAIAAFVVEQKDLVGTFDGEESDELKEMLLKEAKRHILRNMFRIGKRRSEQLLELVENVKHFQAFYKLSLLERAILFLKQKNLLDFGDIEFVTGVERLEIISRLNFAREELLSNSGGKPTNDMIPT